MLLSTYYFDEKHMNLIVNIMFSRIIAMITFDLLDILNKKIQNKTKNQRIINILIL